MYSERLLQLYYIIGGLSFSCKGILVLRREELLRPWEKLEVIWSHQLFSFP